MVVGLRICGVTVALVGVLICLFGIYKELKSDVKDLCNLFVTGMFCVIMILLLVTFIKGVL